MGHVGIKVRNICYKYFNVKFTLICKAVFLLYEVVLFPKYKNFKVKKHIEHYFGDKDQLGHMDSWRWERRAVWVPICDSMTLPNLLTRLI